MIIRILLTILIGIFGGLLGGALGFGQTSIVYPLLVLFNIIPEHKTLVGTLLFVVMFPISLLAVIEYRQRDQIDYLIGLLLTLSFLISTYYGSFINKYYSVRTIKLWSAVLFLILTLFLFYDLYNEKIEVKV